MKYQTEVDRAFTELKIIPRAGQREAVNLVLEQFFDHKKRHVVLSADTGTGKSIIAAAISKCFQRRVTDPLTAFTLMQNNALVRQYADTFGHFDNREFYQIKGAGNYPCSALAELTNDQNANGESCSFDELPDPMKLRYCSQCEFKKAKGLRNETQNLITNYSYYFISKMWSNHLDDRPLTVFDEAHTLNEVFCDHNAIYFSVERLADYADESNQALSVVVEDEVKKMNLIKRLLRDKGITEQNYMKVLKELLDVYKSLSAKFEEHAENQSLVSALKTKQLGKKYFNLGCKIGDLLAYNYDHVFEYIETDEAISVKPVFIGKMADKILGERNLFMSATISDKYIIDTLELDPSTVGFVKLPPVFDRANKEIVFVGRRSLNYGLMNDDQVIKELAQQCSSIVGSHAKLGEKGLILVPSFKVAEQMANGITDRSSRVFVHTRRDKIGELIDQFKAYQKPAVLISPSIFEGLDFADDASRYQIILKAPFPSLGEKRMKHIADKYPDIYKLMTLKKIIQGIGRSVRSPEDYATTYVLDYNVKKLFDSDLNVWDDQFTVTSI